MFLIRMRALMRTHTHTHTHKHTHTHTHTNTHTHKHTYARRFKKGSGGSLKFANLTGYRCVRYGNQ